MTPQIDRLRKTISVLRVSTHFYRVSQDIDGKIFIFRVNLDKWPLKWHVLEKQALFWGFSHTCTNLQPNNVRQLPPLKTTTCQLEKWSVQMPDKVWDIYVIWGLPVTLPIIIAIWLNISDKSVYHITYQEIWQEKHM